MPISCVAVVEFQKVQQTQVGMPLVEQEQLPSVLVPMDDDGVLLEVEQVAHYCLVERRLQRKTKQQH